MCWPVDLQTLKYFLRQVIIYVDDANDEVPVFTQQQYNRLGLKETAGIGTSVIVVRATDPDTGESQVWSVGGIEGSCFSFRSPSSTSFYPNSKCVWHGVHVRGTYFAVYKFHPWTSAPAWRSSPLPLVGSVLQEIVWPLFVILCLFGML